MIDDPRVIIEFNDGECVEAWLLDADTTEHFDITYDVIRVIRGDPKRYVHPNAVYLAPMDEIVRMTPVPGAP